MVERCVVSVFLSFLEKSGAFGKRQFAYRKGHSARDLLFLLTAQWVLTLHRGQKVGLFLSDISGAFDRMAYERLVRKIRRAGLGKKMTNFLSAYFAPRVATVVVEGRSSAAFEIANQAFQGTVLGPPLWNLFFSDLQLEVRAAGGEGSIYADDLNVYKVFDKATPSDDVLADLASCAEQVHQWGAWNQVKFDPSKEAFCILHRTEYYGEIFALLGVDFDLQLSMAGFCETLAKRCSNKTTALIRTRHFYTVPHLVCLYKTQVLSLLELPTPSIFHAAQVHLDKIDAVQRRFLRAVGPTESSAFLEFGLAPLRLRRCIAMLGAIHRCVHGKAHPDLRGLFQPEQRPTGSPKTRRATRLHSKQLKDHCDSSQSASLQRSVWGLVRVWNELPVQAVELTNVGKFQRFLQHIALVDCKSGGDSWRDLFSSMTVGYRR